MVQNNRQLDRWLDCCVIILVVVALLPTTTLSWIPQPSSSIRSHNFHARFFIENSGSRRRPLAGPSLKLSAFLWFGGNDDKKDEEGNNTMTSTAASSNSVPTSRKSSTLRGVSNIIDSMASFKSSQRVGERTSAALQELSNILVEGTSADGKVKVTFNGQQVPVGVQIDETYLRGLLAKRAGMGNRSSSSSSSNINSKEGVDQLCTALTEAMKEAQAKSAAKVDDKLKSLYSDLGFDS